MSKIPEISIPLKFKLANKLDISKFSESKLTINPDLSWLSKSLVNNLYIDVIVEMFRLDLFKIHIISDNLIADKS